MLRHLSSIEMFSYQVHPYGMSLFTSAADTWKDTVLSAFLVDAYGSGYAFEEKCNQTQNSQKKDCKIQKVML